jgi:hypothetical protein
MCPRSIYSWPAIGLRRCASPCPTATAPPTLPMGRRAGMEVEQTGVGGRPAAVLPATALATRTWVCS